MSVAFVARAACGALLAALPLSCGERAGDPVIALPSSSPPRGDGGAGGESPGALGGASGAGNPGPGPGGLCAPCQGSDECGDANDACIRHGAERFCGRDCDEQRGCPDGYACVQLTDSQLLQCVPVGSCVSPTEPAPALADLRAYVLARINAERTARDRVPLEGSSCLNELAQDSALAYARTDEPLGKYVKECDPIWPSCACGWTAEAEVSIARYDLDWQTAVERALDSTRDPASDRVVNAYLSSAMTHVGIGFWLSGDEAWIALSFR
jgi:hypothetical protein